MKKNRESIICIICGKEKYLIKSRIDRGEIFCSNQCSALSRKGKPRTVPVTWGDKISKAKTGKSWGTHTKEWKEGASKRFCGENNPRWKGDKVGYYALHIWMKKVLPKPKVCPSCKKLSRLDLANISPKYDKKTYTRDKENWEWLCRKCHIHKDGRLKNLWVGNLKNYGKDKGLYAY